MCLTEAMCGWEMSKTWTETGTCYVDLSRYEQSFKVKVLGKFSKSLEGQDADGNRGMMMTFLDDLEIIEVEFGPEEAYDEIEEKVANLGVNDIEWDGNAE